MAVPLLSLLALHPDFLLAKSSFTDRSLFGQVGYQLLLESFT